MSTAPFHAINPEPDVRVELITPDKAAEYLAANTHNRNLRQRVVDSYVTDMLAGDWLWNGESIKFATDGALLDGQHRLAAIVKAGVAVRVLVVRDLPPQTQETIDTGAKRKFSDVLNLRGETSYVSLAATIRAITAWVDGYRSMTGATRAYTNTQLLHTLETYPWIREGISEINRATTHSRLPATVGGLTWWLFMEIDPEDAHHFFARLTSDENHRAGEPIYTLRKLLTLNEAEVRGERSKTYLSAVTIKAWNKYRAGEQCGQLRFRSGGANPEAFPEPK